MTLLDQGVLNWTVLISITIVGENSLNDRSHAMDIGHLKNHQSYFEKLPKNRENDPFNRKNWIFKKKIKSLQFLIVQGSLNPNITFLVEKLWPVAWN